MEEDLCKTIETEAVLNELCQHIEALLAVAGNYAPLAALRYGIKKTLLEAAAYIEPDCREQVAGWLVNVCEAAGRALLTEAEIGFWWEEPKFYIPLPGPAPLPEGWPR